MSVLLYCLKLRAGGGTSPSRTHMYAHLQVASNIDWSKAHSQLFCMLWCWKQVIYTPLPLCAGREGGRERGWREEGEEGERGGWMEEGEVMIERKPYTHGALYLEVVNT